MPQTAWNRVGRPCRRASGLTEVRARTKGNHGGAVKETKQCTGEEGSSLIEFAISVPILLTFFFGLIQVCIATYTRDALSECAREGTRYAMVHGSSCLTASNASCTLAAPAINTFAASASFPNIGGGTMTVNTTYPDGNENPGSRVQVNVTYAYPFHIPYIPASTLSMNSTSVMYIVQ